MFDVDWSDPTRESVGDRRARKDKKGKEKGKDNGNQNDDDQDQDEERTDAQSGNRTSGSVRSSVSSVDKQFGFFGGKHRKKGGASSSRKGKTQSVASSSLQSPTTEERPHSNITSTSSPTTNDQAPQEQTSRLAYPPSDFSSFAESVFNDLDDTERAPGGSLFGCDITNPQPGTTTQFQEFGDGVSMITKTTVVSSWERTEGNSDYLVSKIHVSARDPYSQQPNSSAKKLFGQKSTHFNEGFNELTSEPVSTPDQQPSSEALQRPASSEMHQLPTIQETSNCTNGAIVTNNAKPKQPVRLKTVAPAIPPASMRPTTNADAWKAPDDWAVSPTESAISGVEDLTDTAVAEKLAALALDLALMERESERMLEASPRAILLRLKEEAGVRDLDVARAQSQDGAGVEAVCVANGALACRDREMEKQRWLLSALYNMESIWDTTDKGSKPVAKPSVQKILSLFDNQGTTSYLAVSNAHVSVYHLSPEPLLQKQYPNVHPMLCPIVSASTLAFAADTFSSISCIGITSMLPSSDLPKLLNKINHILAPGGLLHMVVIDPSPVATSLGPMLREWLDAHLLFNLELQFRVTRPSRFFPIWLEEAKLRGKGSIITQTRFQAIAGRGDRAESSGTQRQQQTAAAAVNKDLRCIVGRLLWQQIWGPFVSCDKWWWEVPQIVDECLEKQTHWEYSIIAACKAWQ